MTDKFSHENRIGFLVILVILVYLLGSVIHSFFENDLTESDIIQLRGKVVSYKEVKIGVNRKYLVGILRMKSPDYVFRISGSSLNALKEMQFEKHLKKGESITVGTTQDQLQNSNDKSLISKIRSMIETKPSNPEVFYLKHNNQDLLTVANYNYHENKAQSSNLLWGGVVFLFGIFLFSMMLYADIKSVKY